MATSNLARQLRELVAPKQPLFIGTISAVTGADVTVTLPGGQTIRARGAGWSVGAAVFVRDGVIEGSAPTLPVEVHVI